jgi:hypothetical protein
VAKAFFEGSIKKSKSKKTFFCAPKENMFIFIYKIDIFR